MNGKQIKNGNGRVDHAGNGNGRVDGGNGVVKAEPPIGGTVTITEKADMETVKLAIERMDSLSQLLGEKYEAFKADEAALLQALGKARQERDTAVKLIGKKNGLDLESGKSGYGFDLPSMTFTRTI